jgi:nucleoside-diphosphate kinase
MEQTLVIIKPDGLKRGLSGEIISRFENVGLKLVAARMIYPAKGTLEKHYSDDKAYLTRIGEKTLEVYENYQYDVKKILGTDDAYELGLDVREKLIKYTGAVELVRKMVGTTTPLASPTGTIRGDYSHDSQLSAPLKGRAMNTIVHASGNKEEADFEIHLWFGKKFRAKEYQRIDEVYF